MKDLYACPQPEFSSAGAPQIRALRLLLGWWVGYFLPIARVLLGWGHRQPMDQ